MPTMLRSTQQSCRVFVLICSLTYLLLGTSFAQKPAAPAPPPAPKYDLQTEAKIKGSVLEIKAPEKEKDNVHMMIKSGEETLDVLLCPKSFLTEMGITFAKGDEVVVTGSKIKVEESNLVLAREVQKGEDSLILRDAKGAPAWNWKH